MLMIIISHIKIVLTGNLFLLKLRLLSEFSLSFYNRETNPDNANKYVVGAIDLSII